MAAAKSRKSEKRKPRATVKGAAPWLGIGRRGPLPMVVTPVEMRLLGARLTTIHEAAAALNMARSTLQARLAENPELRQAWDQGRDDTLTRLRDRQLAIALDAEHPQSAMMLVHLGKALLGQSERHQHELTGAGGGPIRIAEIRRVIVHAALSSASDDDIVTINGRADAGGMKLINGSHHESDE